MPVESTRITTYTCSISACDTKPRVIAGDRPEVIAQADGWKINEPLLNYDLDLCPEHVRQLRNWITGDD